MPADYDTLENKNTFDEAALLALRGDMVRFALLQLRDSAAAEDAVQDALTAALGARARYAARAQLKTWVFAILRNKIVDLLRERTRHPKQSFDDSADIVDELDDAFDRRGFWRKDARPTRWSHPETELENTEFWRVFDACLNYLPENTARVFMMREMLELETVEICRTLDISERNCWVILHRARMRLRLCLAENWFDGEKAQ